MLLSWTHNTNILFMNENNHYCFLPLIMLKAMFSFVSNTEYDEAKGSRTNPSISIPHASIHVIKSFSMFLAIVTKCTLDSSLCPDNPKGFFIPLLSSILKFCERICNIFRSGDKFMA